MGVNLTLTGVPDLPSGEHVTDLATNHGYTLLMEWMLSLPEGAYPAAVAFAEAGEYTPTDELADQLERAFAEHPPEDPNVFKTADRLLDLLGGGNPGETAAVTP